MTLASEEGRYAATAPDDTAPEGTVLGDTTLDDTASRDLLADTASQDIGIAKPSTAVAQQMTKAAWIALAAVYVLWGSTYLGIRYAIESIPPLSSAALRFILAGLILGGFLAIRRGPSVLRVTRGQLASAALIGLLLLLGGNGFVVLSEQYIPVGTSALLVASVPLWIVVFRALTKDRPNARTLVGVLIGFAGLVVLMRPGGGGAHNYLLGVSLVLIASVSWAFGSVASKAWLTPPKDVFVASAYQMVFGGIGCAVAAALHGEHFHPGAVTGTSAWATLYLVAAGSLVAFCSYVWLLKNAPISTVATYAYVNPVVAVALGALFLNEAITLAVVVGGLIVVLGVAVVIATERR
ncbi:EamA family transporter [Catenulispora pinisilvae]|uniref:EamA family transporter n=1 Tax=Catenulispora pinisilvae TaxID=2705253 RepID=UPI001E47599B|nr:EamA family transporter [Catenulispora pinisilvae]